MPCDCVSYFHLNAPVVCFAATTKPFWEPTKTRPKPTAGVEETPFTVAPTTVCRTRFHFWTSVLALPGLSRASIGVARVFRKS